MANRKDDLAKIHIAKKDLALDEHTYRSLISRVTKGKHNSSATLDYRERSMVLEEFKRLGWKPKRSKNKKKGPVSRHGVSDKIRAIWINMHQEGIVRDPSEQALNKWVGRMSAPLNDGAPVASVEWLCRNPKLETHILETLKKWRKRVWRERKEANFDLIKRTAKSTRQPAEEIAKQLLEKGEIYYWYEFNELWGLEPPEQNENAIGIEP